MHRLDLEGKPLLSSTESPATVTAEEQEWLHFWQRYAPLQKEDMLKDARSGKIKTVTCDMRDEKGERHWWDVTILPVFGAQGALNHFLVLTSEVTAYHQIQAALEEQLRLAQLNMDVSIALTRELSLQEMLKHCAAALVKNLGAERACIWTLDEQEKVLELQADAGVPIENRVEHMRIPLQSKLIGEIVQTKRPILTNSLLDDIAPEGREAIQKAGMVAFAGFPLMIEQRAVGVMVVFTRNPLTGATFHAMESVSLGIALGIERKNVEEGQKRMGLLIEQSTNAICAVSLDGYLLQYNPACSRMLGLPAQSAPRSLRLLDCFPQKVRQRLQEALRQVHETGQWEGELELRNASSGKEIVIALSIILVADPQSRRSGWLALAAHDITAQKHVESTLKKSEEMFRTLANQAPMIIWRSDEHGNVIYANELWKRFTGLEVKEGEDSMSWLSLLHPEDRSRIIEARTAAHKARRTYQDQARMRRADGEYRTLVVTGSPCYDARGTFSGFIGVNMDITERQRAEEERTRLLHSLAVERSRFEEVLRNLPSGVLIAEAPSGRIMMGNEQVERIFRGKLFYAENVEQYNEWTGWHLDGTPMQPHEWPLARAVHGEYATETVKYLRGDGTIGFITMSGAPIKDEHNNTVAGVVVINDITEQKMLERKQEAFFSIISHELKTPLTAIQGNVQLAMRRIKRIEQREELPEHLAQSFDDIQGFLDRCQQQLRVQNRLINDLLDISRAQSDRLEIHPSLCDLYELVTETVLDQQSAQPQREIRLELPPKERIQVKADRDRIGQVLLNYLTNALKYSPVDKPVTVGLDVEPRQVRVWVRDQGPGLSPKAQRQVWEQFYQEPTIQASSKIGVGLGLGLYICQKLIRDHQGEVGVDSKEGEGSTFWFTLPLSE
jgi:PAS domain S-box-containing protein